MFGFKPYNYESFSRDLVLAHLARRRTGSGPRPGEPAPDFEARTLDGDKVRLGDFRGKKNLVLTFGSATCPFTAGSIRGLNRLYAEFEGEDVAFLFVYVREAHPGERLPAHRSLDDKVFAAELFRKEEEVEPAMVVDDLDGSIHRTYGKMPNASFLVDRSGRIAFRQLWTRPKILREALEQLLEWQQARDEDHVVIGEDRAMPVVHGILHSHRALERGGRKSMRDYRQALGVPGRLGHGASRMAEPVVLHPGRALAAAAVGAAVVAGGIYVGLKLRREREESRREPYRRYRVPSPGEGGEEDYVVGI